MYDVETQTGAGLRAPHERAGRREWIGLAVLALPTLLVSLDMSVLFLALPSLSADLGPNSTQQLWILDIYGFMVAGFLVTMGTLGDRIGRRKLLLYGAAAFGVASVLAAYSTSAEMLIATRALMGIAGATLMPSTLALISNMFTDAKQRGTAIAAWMSCFMIGTIIGPLVGGTLLEAFWWGSVFLLGVPVMVLLLVTAPVLLPEYRDTGAGRLDLTSVALSLGAILPIIYGLKEIAKNGLHGSAVAVIVAGVALGGAFVYRQRRLTHPLVDLHLFSNRSFRAALGIMMVGGIVMAGTFLFVPLYLQMVEGLSPLQAGLWLVPPSLAMIASTQLTPHLARRIRPAYVMAGGLTISALGCLLVTQVDVADGPVALVAGLALACIGVAPPTTLGIEMVVGSAPPEKAGSAASVSETGNEFGIAMGMALMGSLGTAVYRNQIAISKRIPTEAAQAARDSIAGAVSAAGQLPAASANELLHTAREAFTTGLNTVAGVGAVLFVAIAVVAVVTLRHVRPSGEQENGQTDSVPAAGTDCERREPCLAPAV